MEMVLEFIYIFLVFVTLHGSRYLVFAIGSFMLLQKFSSWTSKRKIQHSPITKKDIQRELKYAFGTILVSALVLVSVFNPIIMPYTKFYPGLMDKGATWLIGSYICLVLIHDTYFYWIHRALHHPVLFKRIHRIHHLSSNPCSMTSQAFHPVEAFLHIAFIVPLIFFMPMHISVIGLFGFTNFIYNVYGHGHVEIIPDRIRKHWTFRFFGTAVIHNAHHSEHHRDYGLYFRFWDKMMKTDRKNIL